MTTAISASIDTILQAPSTTYPYIYGIIPTNDRVVFDVAGIDHVDDVYTISNAGLSAVISNISVSHFQGMSRPLALHRLAAHQVVIESVMRDYPVLPVKFGTILSDEAHVQRMLTQGATLFAGALEQYAEKRQIEIVMLWELPAVFAEISAEPEIIALKAQIEGRPNEATMAERVAFGQAVEAALERRRAALGRQVIAAFDGLACDMVINPTMDTSMVVNLALLIDEARREEFDQRLQLLDQQFSGQFQFRCVGPLPPYSFATVAIQALSFETIDTARRLLDLADSASSSEIKHAYRAHAALVHPDHNGLDADAEEHMTALTRAYKLLNLYTASHAMLQPDTAARHTHGERQCWFDRATVERTLLIAMCRQDAAQEPAV